MKILNRLLLLLLAVTIHGQGTMPALKSLTVNVDTNGVTVAPTNFWAANSNNIAAVLPPGNGGGQTVSVNGSAVSNPNLIDDATALVRASGSSVTIYPTNLANAQLSPTALIALTKLAQIADQTILGNNSGGSATPSALTTLPNGVQDNITRLGTVTSGNIGAGLITSGSLNSARIPTGVGVTNSGGVISANLAAGANVTITTGANGQQTIAASASGGTVTVSEQDGAPSVAANTIKFNNGTVTDNGGGVVSVSNSASGGDFSSNTSTSVDGEVVLFSGTGGKTGKRATGTGIVKLTSGVQGTATAGTDYAPATSGSAILKGNGAGGFSSAVASTDYIGATSGSAIQKANGSGGLAAATPGADYMAPTVGTMVSSGTWAAGDLAKASDSTGTNFVHVTAQQVNDAAHVLTALGDAATITGLDLSVSDKFIVTLGGNRTLPTPSNIPSGGKSFTVWFVQDGTGNRTISYSTNYLFGADIGSTVLTTTNGIADVVKFEAFSTNSVVRCIGFVKGYQF